MKLSINAKRAVKNYGVDVCEIAFRLFSEGKTIAWVATCAVFLTKAQTTAAINAGRELKALDSSVPADEPMHEAVTPGTLDGIMRDYQVEAVEGGESFLANSARQLVIDRAPGGGISEVIVVCNEAFERITQVIECDKPNPALKELMARPVRFVGRLPGWKVNKVRPGHRPRTYSRLTLGIDSWKVIHSRRRHYAHTYEAALLQDIKVCAIEQELWMYDGKRRTPQRDRKVAKLRKILRILKRGLYE